MCTRKDQDCRIAKCPRVHFKFFTPFLLSSGSFQCSRRRYRVAVNHIAHKKKKYIGPLNHFGDRHQSPSSHFCVYSALGCNTSSDIVSFRTLSRSEKEFSFRQLLNRKSIYWVKNSQFLYPI